MKVWLRHIWILFLGLFLTACQDSNEPLVDAGNTSTLKVRMQVYFPVSTRGFYDGGTDPNTSEERALAEDDIYVLVFRNDILKDRIQGLKVTIDKPVATSNTGKATIEGECPMPKGTGPVELVFFANLYQENNLDGVSSNDTIGVHAVLDNLKNKSKSDVYKSLKYNYDPTSFDNKTLKTGWKEDRRIPMWGSTGKINNPGTTINSACDLHRALAKFVFQINDGDGYKNKDNKFDRRISRIKISSKKLYTQGFCAPSTELSADGYVSSPSVESSLNSRPEIKKVMILYNDENKTKENSSLDKTRTFTVYFPEQDVMNYPEIVIFYQRLVKNKWEYTKKGKNIIPTEIELTKIVKDDPYGVRRNHSYVYNLIKTPNSIDFDLRYQVMGWLDKNIALDFE